MDKVYGIWTKEKDTMLNDYLFQIVKQKFETLTDIELNEMCETSLKSFIIRWTDLCFRSNQEKQNRYSSCYSQSKCKGDAING